jgi:hypothetical protein
MKKATTQEAKMTTVTRTDGTTYTVKPKPRMKLDNAQIARNLMKLSSSAPVLQGRNGF